MGELVPRSMLVETDKGGLKKCISNFLTIMENDPYYSNLRYNTITNKREVDCSSGDEVKILEWTDADEARSQNYIEMNYKVRDDGCHDKALLLLFEKREYNPITQIIDGLVWDGVNRCEHFLTKWALADDTPYVHEVSRLIFAGGIWRAYRAGCKFDDVPVLVGTQQGEGKSSLIKFLAINDRFFSDNITEMDGTKAVEQLDGVWIGEIAELLALTRQKDVEAAKAYITRQKDAYRKPYSPNTETRPRRCILIGTTNNEQFLRDKTGNRRFYPVVVHSDGRTVANQEPEIREYVLQCWAEAKHRFDEGNMPNFSNGALLSEYQRQQEKAMEDDWRIGVIGEILDRCEANNERLICVKMIFDRLYPDQHRKCEPYESREIGQILQKYYSKTWQKCDSKQRVPDWGIQYAWKLVRKTPPTNANTLPF